MINIISIAWFGGIFLEVFILKSGVSHMNFINSFGNFFCNCISSWEGLERMNMWMIVLVAPDEYGDDEELKDSKEHHEQAEH